METIPDPGLMDTGTSSIGKADLGKRFVAVLIDGLIAGAIGLVLGLGGRGLLYGVGTLVGVAYILLRDGMALDFMNGRSIGKKVMKLRPIRLDGGAMDINTSVRRNWPLAVGNLIWGVAAVFGGLGIYLFAGLLAIIAWLGSLLGLVEGILVLTDSEGRRIGDKFAGTKVIESGD